MNRPREVMEAMCARFDIEFHPDLVQPYKDREKKMLDGVHPESTPMSDPKFDLYQRIEPSAAESWTVISAARGASTGVVAIR